MNEKVGEVFAIAADNAPVPGCTVSKAVHSGANDVIYFSMAPNTDISAEIFPYHKLILVAGGSMEVYGRGGFVRRLDAGECIVTPTDTPVGMRTMNEAIKAGEVFELAGLVPYADGKIVNMDVAHNGKMKFVVMAFDEGTALSEHAAPGEALVFALDGEGVIGYEGKDHPIKAGESFHFAKAGLHSVRATKRFKMALLLTLE